MKFTVMLNEVEYFRKFHLQVSYIHIKTNTELADLNPTVSIITLNASGLNRLKNRNCQMD